jgi:hypothetical protein
MATAAETAPAPAEKPAKPRVSERPANTEGQVLVVEYHRITPQEARWDRSIERFKADLKRLYEMGFRPVTLRQYIDNDMDLPPGASPVVFTWDDSDVTQFRILDDGTIDPNSGVGIWQEFAKEHPDFPVRASFYILPPTRWGQAKWFDRKMELLKEWGCEVGSHTISHGNLKKMTDEQVKKEFAESIDFIEGYGFECTSLALPFGIAPQNAQLLREFEYNGKKYGFRAALLVGANPAPPSTSDKFDPYRIPRIQAIEGLNGINFWLDKVESGEVQVYVEP